jgi:photosystem II stability/assembly factor-like uncharacterized protein
VAAYTFDAGKTWKESPVPFDRCTAGGLPYNRASDPSMAIGPDGIAYFAGVAFTEVRHATHKVGELESSTIAVASSRNGGIGWSRPVPLGADKSRPFSNDKVWVTADPVKPRTAYVVWDRYDTVGTSGSVRFSKTSDGGRTWSRPRAILKQPT